MAGVVLGMIDPDDTATVHVVIMLEGPMLEIKTLVNDTNYNTSSIKIARQTILGAIDELASMCHAHSRIGTQLSPSADFHIINARHGGYTGKLINGNLSSDKAVEDTINPHAKLLQGSQCGFVVYGNKRINHLNAINHAR